MREHRTSVQWLQDSAHFYVCGDAGRIAKEVGQDLKDIVAAHGGMDTDVDVAACGGRIGGGGDGLARRPRARLAVCDVTRPWPGMPAWPSCAPESGMRAKQKRPWGGGRKRGPKPPRWVGAGRFGLFGGRCACNAHTLRDVYGVT